MSNNSWTLRENCRLQFSVLWSIYFLRHSVFRWKWWHNYWPSELTILYSCQQRRNFAL